MPPENWTPTTGQVIDYFVEGYLHTHDGVGGDGREGIIRWHNAEVAAAKAEALRKAAEDLTILIPDALGYKVQAVFTEALWERADQVERSSHE